MGYVCASNICLIVFHCIVVVGDWGIVNNESQDAMFSDCVLAMDISCILFKTVQFIVDVFYVCIE